MYKLDSNKNHFIKNIKDLNKTINFNSKYKINTIKKFNKLF